jgi:transposase
VVVSLPPCCPDLNPIELTFAKLRWLLRSAARRTVEDLWDFLGKSLDPFPPEECRC